MFVGIDSCPAGWLVVYCSPNNRYSFVLMSDLSMIWDEFREAEIILIDIPIGLPENRTRECDRIARKILQRKASSVFPPPVRKALQARNYSEACRINQQASGKKISLQTWNICPKIREVDEFLVNLPQSRKCIIRESFPELCFWAFCAGKVMEHSKRKPAGYAERMHVILPKFKEAADFVLDASNRFRHKDVARDDIVDALILTLTAASGLENLITIPVNAPKDEYHLPMEMVFSKKYLPQVIVENLSNL